MSLATYAYRAGGFWLAGRGSYGTHLKRLFLHIPGTVLTAMVVPEALSYGTAGVVAVLTTTAITIRTNNLFLAIAGGVTVMIMFRLAGMP